MPCTVNGTGHGPRAGRPRARPQPTCGDRPFYERVASGAARRSTPGTCRAGGRLHQRGLVPEVRRARRERCFVMSQGNYMSRASAATAASVPFWLLACSIGERRPMGWGLVGARGCPARPPRWHGRPAVSGRARRARRPAPASARGGQPNSKDPLFENGRQKGERSATSAACASSSHSAAANQRIPGASTTRLRQCLAGFRARTRTGREQITISHVCRKRSREDRPPYKLSRSCSERS